MKLLSAAIDGNCLRLELDASSRQEAGSFVYNFKSGDYSLKKTRKKRSLGANALAWVLIDKISAVTGIPKDEVYRQAIRNIGGVSDVVEIKGETAFNQLKRGWEKQGLGWQCIREQSSIPEYISAVLIYGSSVYSKEQMTSLINALQEDCRALGIETLPERELSLLEGLNDKPDKSTEHIS